MFYSAWMEVLRGPARHGWVHPASQARSEGEAREETEGRDGGIEMEFFALL